MLSRAFDVYSEVYRHFGHVSGVPCPSTTISTIRRWIMSQHRPALDGVRIVESLDVSGRVQVGVPHSMPISDRAGVGRVGSELVVVVQNTSSYAFRILDSPGVAFRRFSGEVWRGRAPSR